MPPDQLEGVVERYGIRTVVNLRSELENEKGAWHAREAEVVAREGARLLDLPMNTGYPPDPQVLEAWLRLLDDPASRPLLVHCEYGVVRTGMMVAVFEMEYGGQTNQQAWADFESFGRKLEAPVLGRVRGFITGYRLGKARLHPPAPVETKITAPGPDY